MRKLYITLGIVVSLLIIDFLSTNYLYKTIVLIKNSDTVFIQPVDDNTVIKYAIKSYLTDNNDYYCKQFSRPYPINLPEQPVNVQIKSCSTIVTNLQLLNDAFKTHDFETCAKSLSEWGPGICTDAAQNQDFSKTLEKYFLLESPYGTSMYCRKSTFNCEDYTESTHRLVEYYTLEANKGN